MDDLERRQTEALVRVNNFGIQNAAAISAFPKAVAAFAVIQAAITQLEQIGALRTSSHQTKLSSSARRKLMRNELYAEISRIVKIAADIERDEPDFVNKFRLPRANKSDLVWLETARAFAADLTAVKHLFVEYGFLADFIDDLTADADAFEQAINQQDTANRGRVGANADIDEILGDALKAKRTLDVIVPNIFRDDAGKLADWTAASHVEKTPKRNKGGENPANPANPPA